MGQIFVVALPRERKREERAVSAVNSCVPNEKRAGARRARRRRRRRQRRGGGGRTDGRTDGQGSP
jgi:hypothetical protein